jgi:hypothetical protein
MFRFINGLTYEFQVGPKDGTFLVAQWGGTFKRFESKTEREAWEQYGYGNMFKIPFLGYVVLWVCRL